MTHVLSCPGNTATRAPGGTHGGTVEVALENGTVASDVLSSRIDCILSYGTTVAVNRGRQRFHNICAHTIRLDVYSLYEHSDVA